MPVWFTFAISLLGKFVQPKQSYIVYFDSRYILLVTAVLPALVFELKERWQILACLSSTFFCLFFFDPVNNWLGVGYYQKGFTVESYYYINYIVFIAFTALLAGIFILKWRHENAHEDVMRALEENKRVNADLHNRNWALQNLSHEMEAQNEEIIQQQEQMTTNQEMLAQANRLISEQKEKLQQYNLQLEKLVEEKSGDLAKTNEELIQSNNELRQFSFNVSHNLRGPVARLLGLTNLIQGAVDPKEIPKIIQFIQRESLDLDGILKDLSTIIDIRNDLYRVREKIDILKEWKKACDMIGDAPIHKVKWDTDFSVSPSVFGIKPMVQSILYNLISNAIKYQSPNRPLQIEAKSWTHLDQTILEISDNGIGFDLKQQKENVFKLYKRFHTHVAGKGMGLYLVRTQMQIMNARVDVESEPDQGTTFRLSFPIPGDLDKQVFFENESALLYYDALINNTVIIWKKNVTSSEYREAFDSVLNTIKKYNTPGWIADLRKQGVILPEDQQWFIKNVLAVAGENGLQRIAAVGFHDPVRKDYYDRMIANTGEFGIELKVFSEIDSAVLWMKSFT